MNIYLTRDGKQLGPFTMDELRRQCAAGTLQPGDPAWHEGLAEWTTLGQIPGFATQFPPAVPPYPGAPSIPTADQSPFALRLVTAGGIFIVLFIAMFVVITIVALMIGGGLAGAHAAATQHAHGFAEGQAVGRAAGREFGQNYMLPITGVSALISLVASSLIAWKTAFSNLLPWCQAR